MSLRVLLLSHHERTVLGGAPRADLALAEALARLGHEVESLFYDDVLPSFVRATSRQLVFPWAAAAAALRRRGRWDVLESTAGDAWLARRLLPLLPGPRPLVSVRTHGLEHARAAADRERRRREGRAPGPATRLYHYGWRLAEVAGDLRAADAVFLLNREDERLAVERLGVPAGRVHVLPNGLPDELLALPEPAAGAERGFRLLFLGAWSRDKGADLLPAIARRLFAEDPRFRLTCAGTGVAEGAVLADFAPQDRSRVRVVPRYEPAALPDLLAGHGVFLFPSPAEGCSLALLEAMAAALVPVVSRTGYAADLLVAGRNGFPVEGSDPADFAATVLATAANPEEARRIALRAREAVAGHSWTALAAERVRVWESLRRPEARR